MTAIARQVHRCPWLSRPAGGGWWYPNMRAGWTKHVVPEGTVKECTECDTTWVAGHLPGLIPNVWRQETRLERGLRTRRARQA